MNIMEKVLIHTDYITLQAALKLNNIIGSGGEIKHFLLTKRVFVNQELENRRGKKLYPGDIVQVENENIFQIVKKEG